LNAETEGTQQELEAIFQLLRQRAVDSELDKDAKLRSFVGKPKGSSPAESQVTPPEGLSLFDFVDVDSVNTLRDQTRQEMQSLGTVVQGCRRIASSLSENYLAFRDSHLEASVALSLELSSMMFF